MGKPGSTAGPALCQCERSESMAKLSVLLTARTFIAALSFGFLSAAAVDVLAQTPKAAAPAAAKVDVNSASAAELENLPGVGQATAKKIIAGRPYQTVADLAKAGVPAKTIEKIT